jgi:hypothetical protein
MRIIFALLVFLFSLPVSFAQGSDSPAKVFWSADKAKCPICSHITVEGRQYSTFETDELVLTVSPAYNDKLLYIGVELMNRSGNRIEFDPARAIIAAYSRTTRKKLSESLPMDPDEAAKKLKGNQAFRNFLDAWGGAMARRTATVHTTAGGTVRATDTLTGRTVMGTYSGQSDSQVSIPDEDAQARAQRKIDERNQAARDRQTSVIENALLANTVFANKTIAGTIYFPLIKGDILLVGVMVGNTLYTVPVTGIKN